MKKTAVVGMIMIFSIALDLYCHGNTGLQYLQSSQYKKAYEVFKKNSYVDHAEDQFYLGAMFSEGIYVKKDIDRALYWISKSAENDFPAAQYIYALYLFDGKYIPVDYQNGEFWLRKAATNNYSDAQNTLAVFLYYGIYIKQNKKEAIYWLKKAYQNGNRAAAISVAKLYIYGSDFIKQDKKKGFEILRNESLKRPRNVEACFYLGVHLIFGIYIKKNIAAGTACIDYAVAQGYPPAYLVKGICQMLGYGYKKNHPEGTLNMIHFFFCNSRGGRQKIK